MKSMNCDHLNASPKLCYLLADIRDAQGINSCTELLQALTVKAGSNKTMDSMGSNPCIQEFGNLVTLGHLDSEKMSIRVSFKSS